MSITIHVAVLAWLSAPLRTLVLKSYLLLTALAIPISTPVTAMAEMADLTKALDKLEVNPAASSPPKKPHEEDATLQVSGSASSPPPTQQPEESKAQEASPPPKAQEASSPPKAQEASSPPKASEASSPPKAPEAASPPKAPQAEGSKEKAEPSGEAKALSPPEDDLLEFTSATEGEEGGSSSAWDLVPPELPKISRKKGTKSDSELDSLMKKVIKEDLLTPPSSSPPPPSSKAAITSIAEEPTEDAEAEKTPSEPDFSFEDGPEQSKDTVTAAMGRKDLLTMDVTSDDAEADQEMVNVDHPASGKRKGRPASHGAKKRALPPKSPRTSSVGARAKSPPPRHGGGGPFWGLKSTQPLDSALQQLSFANLGPPRQLTLQT